MAHLWISHEPGKWETLALGPEGIDMVPFPPQPLAAGGTAVLGDASAVLLRFGRRDGVWALIGGGQGPDIRVNGMALRTGIRILADRDEIVVGDRVSIYFSTEELAAVESLPETGNEPFCPRCKQRISSHSPVVRCPKCGVFYHQSQDLPCWTYADVCALCPHPTALDVGYQWTPEKI